MKRPNELEAETRILVLNILKDINLRMDDYSDVQVGNVIMPQSLTHKPWLPNDCIGVPHKVIELLDDICEYGFLERDEKILCFHITRFGLEYLKMNL